MTQKWISQAWIMLVCKYMLTHTHSHLILVVASHKPCNICGNCNFFPVMCPRTTPDQIKQDASKGSTPTPRKNLLLSFIHARTGGPPYTLYIMSLLQWGWAGRLELPSSRDSKTESGVYSITCRGYFSALLGVACTHSRTPSQPLSHTEPGNKACSRHTWWNPWSWSSCPHDGARHYANRPAPWSHSPTPTCFGN